MAKSRKPGDTPRRKKPTKWDYQRVPNGTSVTGWKAGEYFGCETHFLGMTRPCKRHLTEGELNCPLCEAGEETVWRGYCPFYDSDYKRKFVLIPEDVADRFEEIEALAAVRVSRAKGSRESVVIRPEGWTLKTPPAKVVEVSVSDFFAWLVFIWEDDEITQWAAKEAVKEAEAKPKLTIEQEKAAIAAAGKKTFVVRGTGVPPMVGKDVEAHYRKFGHLENGNGSAKH